MAIADFLSPDHVLAKVAATDKEPLLRALCHRAAASVHLPEALIAREILKREALGSTGVGGGIGLPHARMAGIAKPFGLIAQLKKTIDFEAVDGQPVDIVFLLLMPADREEENRNALASVARKLRDPAVVAAIRKGRDEAAISMAQSRVGRSDELA